ncbi:SDR family NAD(P)-dependent oxidoreductase [Rhodovastum atsumiense]|uniref:NADP-dependent 3-hydroxy acid dehydrogenase YdfG n=1 Tax=Rhodovastum atsumiense TaxID=504468 RepID=A0A5M6IJB2_9PROT|nr:SDR family oxidoreductase [Rhodovastum atsumiense]KAA5608353.1 SDR family oxidoreductase [Rhodovastum atsumiense]
MTRNDTHSDKGTAVVTGASSGIGAIYADRLARRGHDLILIARSRDRLTAQAQRISNETGRAVEVLAADLADPAALAGVEATLRRDASVTLLVNNAGFGTFAPLLDSDVDTMEAMIRLNVIALTRLTYAVAPGMVARGTGAIINIASIVSLAPELLNGVYGGSKAFVHAFTTSLQHELGGKGIRVQAVLPGATATEFWPRGGLNLEQLPPGITMRAEDMVDAALAGFDQGEVVTIPALADITEWQRFEAARTAMAAHLSATAPPPRYGLHPAA